MSKPPKANPADWTDDLLVWQFRAHLQHSAAFPHNHPMTDKRCPPTCCVRRAHEAIEMLGDRGLRKP